MKILIASYYAGFHGAAERWMYNSTKQLREEGFVMRGSFRKTARGSEKFLKEFDTVGAFEGQAADCDLVLLNKMPEIPLLKRALSCFPHKLALMVHDHDYYCPRRQKCRPGQKRCCTKPYRYLSCGLCGISVAPAHWHGGFGCAFEEKFLTFPNRFKLFRQIPRFAVLSESMKRNLIINGIEEERITVIPPHIEIPMVEHVGTIDGGPPMILFSGPMIRGRGGDRFLHVLTKLKEPYRARLLGDGHDWDLFLALSSQLKVRGNVEFAGWQENPETCFTTSDIAAFPFHSQEPFSMEGLTAGAYGLPIVASRSGGAEEFVADGQTGFLVPPGDLDAMAEKLDILLKDARLRRQFGEAGRFYITETFTRERFLNGVRTLADSVGW
ncbi:MAG: glycosyltransferase family 4 protein [Lentisphaeria bacterium]|nr:glycosyltransferase family 4 protein [Lentisphaeria bacterium]